MFTGRVISELMDMVERAEGRAQESFEDVPEVWPGEVLVRAGYQRIQEITSLAGVA